MHTEKIGMADARGAVTGKHLHFGLVGDPAWLNPRYRPTEDVTRPHEHWCAVCGIGLGGDA